MHPLGDHNLSKVSVDCYLFLSAVWMDYNLHGYIARVEQGIKQPDKPASLKVHKDVVMKQQASLPCM